MTIATDATMTTATIAVPYVSSGRPSNGRPNPRASALSIIDLMYEQGHGIFRRLRDPETPREQGTYNVLKLIGGRIQYIRTCGGKDNNRLPWQRRLNERPVDSYVIWGRQTKDGSRIFDSGRPAYTSTARGVVYSRWAEFGHNGRIERYRGCLYKVEVHISDTHSERGDTLRVKVHKVCLHFDDGDDRTASYQLHFWDDDQLWQELSREALRGFNTACSDQLPADTETWRTWFLEQRAAAEADRLLYPGGFHEWVKGKDYITALDAVREAWQLSPALWEYRHMFPEVPPNPNIEHDPGYSGTTGGMEGRLLEAYFQTRPERREPFAFFMEKYSSQIDGLRNYTGD